MELFKPKRDYEYERKPSAFQTEDGDYLAVIQYFDENGKWFRDDIKLESFENEADARRFAERFIIHQNVLRL